MARYAYRTRQGVSVVRVLFIGGLGRKEEKIMALSLLASQVSKAGDRELAADIMKDAQNQKIPN